MTRRAKNSLPKPATYITVNAGELRLSQHCLQARYRRSPEG
jgi:hypothetical protein